MNLVFQKKLEIRKEDNKVATADVRILEEDGNWKVLWSEFNKYGVIDESVWFEGEDWNDMLKVFRNKLSEKFTSGYVPQLGWEQAN